GDWQGQVDEHGKVTGTLLLDHATAQAVPFGGNLSTSGAIDVQSTADGKAEIRPRRIDVKTTNPGLPNVWIAAGTITRDDNGVHAQSLQVAAMGGLAVLDASLDPRTMAGDLTARWNGLTLPSNMSHGGSITGSLRMPF